MEITKFWGIKNNQFHYQQTYVYWKQLNNQLEPIEKLR